MYYPNLPEISFLVEIEIIIRVKTHREMIYISNSPHSSIF